jgi:hypothetical protein
VLPNGTLNWSLQTVNAFQPDISTGSVDVDGGIVSVSLSFAPYQSHYGVTFEESGLPSNLNWSVSIDSSQLRSPAGSPLVFEVPNGSYPYQVVAPNGYLARPSGGELAVDGNSTTLHVDFVQSSSGSATYMGSTLLEWGSIIAAVVAIALVIVAVAIRKSQTGQDLGRLERTKRGLESQASATDKGGSDPP